MGNPKLTEITKSLAVTLSSTPAILSLDSREPYGCTCSAVSIYLGTQEARLLRDILNAYIKLKEIEDDGKYNAAFNPDGPACCELCDVGR